MVLTSPAVVRLLVDRNTLATTLYAIAYHYWGDEMHDWEQETFDMEFYEMTGKRVPEINLDKLSALLAAIQSDSFYRDWRAFTYVCRALSGSEDPDDLSEPMMIAEACWGVTEVLLADDTPGKWSEELKRYIGVLLREEGLDKAPRQLQWALLPQEYEGSMYPADLVQSEQESRHHLVIAERYVEEQGLLLFKQLQQLPWMTPEELKKLVS